MLLLVLVIRLLLKAVSGFTCDDDLYKNCKERTEAGDCEVIQPQNNPNIDYILLCRGIDTMEWMPMRTLSKC